MPDRVAVIGAGPLGLMATKNLKEDGFDVTTYETRSYVGGLWKDSEDSTISVLATTVFNSSKFRAAATDFQFTESDDTYPTAPQIYAYFNRYADHFHLRPHLCLDTRVNQILRVNGKWEIEVKDMKTHSTRTEFYDRVCVATGSFFTPKWPKLEGIENFTGRVLHSVDYHDPQQFKDQNVLLLGIHATAQDVTHSLSEHAKKVYISHRSGILFLPRYTDDGIPFDVTQNLLMLFFQVFAEQYFPRLWLWLIDSILVKISDKAFPIKKEWTQITPRRSVAAATPLVADVLYPLLESGFAESVTRIKRVTGPKTVELADGRVLSDIDSIIYCTSYDFDIPHSLIPKSSNKAEQYDPYPDGPGASPNLYNNIFPLHPDPAIRNSLAFLGHGAVALAGFLQFDLLGMSVSQVWRGKAQLPPYNEMLTWRKNNMMWQEQMLKKHGQDRQGTFYACFLPFTPYVKWLDSTAGTDVYKNLGGVFNGLFNWRAWRLWWSDRDMYTLCTKGLLSPTIFRLFGSVDGKDGRKALEWEECRRRMKWENEVCQKATQQKKAELDAKKAQ